MAEVFSATMPVSCRLFRVGRPLTGLLTWIPRLLARLRQLLRAGSVLGWDDPGVRVWRHHRDMTVAQPFDHIRRRPILADNADDQTATASLPGSTSRSPTFARITPPAIASLRSSRSAPAPLMTSMAGVAPQGHRPRDPDRRDVRHRLACQGERVQRYDLRAALPGH